MNKLFKFTLLIFIILISNTIAKENFFEEAKILYDEGKFEESKFLFQRNIVFNPKDSQSYLYNDREKEKNINVTLLLDPENENAMYMLIDLKLKKSDYKKVKELSKKFEIICSSLCNKINSINVRLENIEAKEDS